MITFYNINFTPTGSYDGFVFHNHANSKNGHYITTLANIDGSPLAVGGASPEINKAETYDISTNTWTEVADYPYHDQSVLFVFHFIIVLAEDYGP